MTERTDWDSYFSDIATQVSTRSTCNRARVGAVIVSKERSILSTGYNGSVRGLAHCPPEGCIMEHGHCSTTVHAEINAVAQAARNGTRIDGSKLYMTHCPCWSCFKVVANAGVGSIIYRNLYKMDSRVHDSAIQANILMRQL